ncbi:hypothetical protein VAEKB19_3860005 [Vibrio aestuarianus]|nr:hypothetical protein VAEKB19_3860005 [Vibrio aestuarianus]
MGEINLLEIEVKRKTDLLAIAARV